MWIFEGKVGETGKTVDFLRWPPIPGFCSYGVHHRVNHFAQMNDHYIPVLEYAAPPVSGIPLKEKRRSMGMSVSDRCSQCFLLST